MTDKNLPGWMENAERWFGTFEWIILRFTLLLLLLIEIVHFVVTHWRGIVG